MDNPYRKPSVMLSYGNDDYKIAVDVLNFLQECKADKTEKSDSRYNIDFDKISFTSVDFMGSIINSVERADVTIILVSPTSIESPWVQFELNIALNQNLSKRAKSKDKKGPKDTVSEFSQYISNSIRVIPVLIAPVGSLPPQFWVFNHLPHIDFTVETDRVAVLQKIADRIDELTGTEDRIFKPSIDVSNRFNLQTNYNRLYKQVGGVLKEIVAEQTREFDEKLTAINRAFEASSSLLSPAHITIKETTAREAIWVVSRDLYNDLWLKEFQESIRLNYIRKLKYVYFIEDTKRYEHLKSLYGEMYEELRQKSDPKLGRKKVFPKEDNFTFIPLAPGTVMPFDEVVIYDPEAGRGTSAYVQLSFDQHPNPQTVYIDLPKSTSAEMVQKLSKIRDDFIRSEKAKKK